jgi:sugar lactone lactonase YvrE
MEYRLAGALCGKGAGPGRFMTALRGVEVDGGGLVYAVGDSEVKVFEPSGALARRWPTSLPGHSIAVEAGRAVWVGEQGQVEIFDESGTLRDTWRDGEHLGLVTAIGLLPEHVLIADALDRSIRRYNRQGDLLNDIGKDNRMKGFNIPNGALDFAVDGQEIIHAANPGKHRVERYTPEGELLGHFGRFDGQNPQGFSGCCNPTNVTVADDGRVFVTEKAGPRAKVYDGAGSLLAVIAADVFDPNCKNMDLAVDSKGSVYVVDTVSLEIKVFEPEGEKP